MDNKNIQKAGNDSHQLQLSNCNIIFNLTEEKLSEIVNSEEVVSAINNNGAISQNIIEERKEKFVKELLPKLVKDEILDSLKKPEIIIAIKETMRQAVCTDDEKSYELLSRLLSNRIKYSDDKLIALSLKNASEAAIEITDGALTGLTVILLIEKYVPTSISIMQGLEVLNNMFGIVDLEKLPDGRGWLEQLDILKLVRVETFMRMKNLTDCYSNEFNGYVCVGIKKNSDNYNKAVEILERVNLTKNDLIINELNESYVRLPLVINKVFNSIRHFTKQGDIVPLSIEQQKAYEMVISLYEKNENVLNANKNRFNQMWSKFPNLVKVKEWWNKINGSFTVTTTGYVLAYANLNNINKSIDLPKWELKDLIK